jgi:hypothetical protein
MMKIKPKKINAIISLNPTAIFGMVDDEIQNYEPKDEQPTESAIQSKLVELISDWDSQEYARNRALEYPSLLELTVALYDTDDKSAVEAKRASVKLKYPKPE